MIRKFRNTLITLSLLLTPLLAMTPAYASTFQQDACSGLTQVDSTQGCGSKASTDVVSNIAKIVINFLSVLVGIIAVVMIIVGGLRYTTSGGDSAKVSSAKTAIVSAIIGLVIVASAQLIVHFAYGAATSGTCATDRTLAANDPGCKK